MPLPSRRPLPPRRPTRHTQTSTRSSSGSFTQTGAAGFGGPGVTGIKASTPAKPLSPGTPAGTLLLPDLGYDKQIGAIDQNTQNTVSGLTGERDRGLLDYGYNVQYDAEGNPINSTLSFDPTNVFSRAAQLRKRWMESRSGTRNGMAAAGQMNSGAYGRAQRQNNYGESQQTDAEMKGLIEFLARNGTQISGAKIAGETAKGEAMGARVDRIPTNPLYNPTPGGPSGPGIGAGTTQPGSINYNARPYQTKVTTDSKGRKGELRIYPNGRKVFVPY